MQHNTMGISCAVAVVNTSCNTCSDETWPSQSVTPSVPPTTGTEWLHLLSEKGTSNAEDLSNAAVGDMFPVMETLTNDVAKESFAKHIMKKLDDLHWQVSNEQDKCDKVVEWVGDEGLSNLCGSWYRRADRCCTSSFTCNINNSFIMNLRTMLFTLMFYQAAGMECLMVF